MLRLVLLAFVAVAVVARPHRNHHVVAHAGMSHSLEAECPQALINAIMESTQVAMIAQKALAIRKIKSFERAYTRNFNFGYISHDLDGELGNLIASKDSMDDWDEFRKRAIAATEALQEAYKGKTGTCMIPSQLTIEDKKLTDPTTITLREGATVMSEAMMTQLTGDPLLIDEEEDLERSLAVIEGKQVMSLELTLGGWIRRIGEVAGHVIAVVTPAASIACLIATAVTAGAAAPVCLGIAVAFSVSNALAQVTQAETFWDVPKALIRGGVDVALLFTKGAFTLLVQGAMVLLGPSRIFGWDRYSDVPQIIPNHNFRGIGVDAQCRHDLQYRIGSDKGAYSCELPGAASMLISPRNNHADRRVLELQTLRDNYCAVIFPPHPWLGGTYNNEVAVAISGSLLVNGFKTFRVDYVEGRILYSTQVQDGVDFIRDIVMGFHKCSKVLIIGYSYGAAIAAHTVDQSLKNPLTMSDVLGLVLISPPLTYIRLAKFGLYSSSFTEGFKIAKPIGISYGGGDQYCRPIVFEQIAPDIQELRGDHFTSVVQVPQANHVWMDSKKHDLLLYAVRSFEIVLQQVGSYFP